MLRTSCHTSATDTVITMFSAIKFTALVPREKVIRVSLGASVTEPSSTPQMPFLPIETADIEDDMTSSSE